MVLDKPYDLIETIAEAKKIFSVSDTWWRGQPVSSSTLIPGVYRDNRDSGYERNITLRFKSRAPARYSDCPTSNTDWLVLMQHYRLPTRLLDWTLAPLVALFFAVSETEYDIEPAALWGLDPYILNKHQMGTNVALGTGSSMITAIADRAFSTTLSPGSNRTLALYPSQIDIR